MRLPHRSWTDTVPFESRPASELMGTPVMVTGGAGFIGSHTVRALARMGRRVIAIDLPAAIPDDCLRGVSHADVTYVRGDLRSNDTIDQAVEAAGGPVDVVHLAAMQFFREPSPTRIELRDGFSVNCMGSLGLCSGLAEESKLRRFVHISTRSVFAARPPSPCPIPDDSPYFPTGVYGYSKAAAEMAVLAARQAMGLEAVIARITGIFGPWNEPKTVVDRMFAAVVRRSKFSLPTGDADAYELTYVKDTVRGIITLLHAANLESTVYHIASGMMSTLGEVAAAIRSTDPDADIDLGTPGRSDTWPRTALDVSRVAEELGFRAEWKIADAAADFLRIARGGAYGPEVEVGE